MTEEDKELELLKAKRLLEMQKNISLQQKMEEQTRVVDSLCVANKHMNQTAQFNTPQD